MAIDEDCMRAALGAGVDPSGVPWAELRPERIRAQRHSIKWVRYPAEVLPLFVAEMDFAVAPEVRRAVATAVESSDIGYVNDAGPLAAAFADFAEHRWAWQVPNDHVHLATDVATGVVESLRLISPHTGRLVLPTPCYPGFFEMLQELPFEVVSVPLAGTERPSGVASGVDGASPTDSGTERDAAAAHPVGLDLDLIEREFEAGADAFLLCNPHNPHGVPFSKRELEALAALAAKHGVFVVSDEIHAPLTHRGRTFTPFAPIAAAAGALSVTTTSASKGWNIAGAKCSVIVAADERANALLRRLPPEVLTRTSLLGLHANTAAFSEGRDWLDRAIVQIEANQALFERLANDHLPSVRYVPGHAGYLAWLDLRDAGLGTDPAARILDEAKVALNAGQHFGHGGNGFARLNLACAPDTLIEAVARIEGLLSGGGASSPAKGVEQ